MFDLPDFEDSGSLDIIRDNVLTAQALYFAAMLEQMGLFDAMDSLVDSFVRGNLATGRGNAGEKLYRYWKHAYQRISKIDRENSYKRVFGFPGGDLGVTPNREFEPLWLRFLAAVAQQETAEAQEAAGQELAQTLSAHGFGSAHYIAMELQSQIREITGILSEPEILQAFGVKSPWALVERLHAEAHTSAYRAMATSGSTIIGWLARSRDEGHDLKQACEAWLAASASLR